MNSCRFYVYACTTSIIVGSLSCVFTLQSSVQAKNGTGSLSTTSYYACTIASAFVVYPLLLRFLGRKYNLLLGDVSCILFGLTLLMPSQVLPIIVNAVAGLLTCSVWSSAFAIAVSFGSTKTDANTKDVQTGVKNSSCFVAILGFGQSLINILPLAILRNFGSHTIDNVTTNLTSCGAGDCPKEYSTDEDHSIYNNLVPSRPSLYIFVGVLAFLQITVVTVHWALLPNDRPTIPEETPLIEGQGVTERVNLEWREIIMKFFKEPLAAIWRSLITAESSFTFCSQLHFGIVTRFVWLVFSRSFVSCTFGVQQVGLLMLIFYLMSATTCLLAAKCLLTITIRYLTILKSLLDLTACAIAIMWIPSQKTFYVVYVLAALFGICQGLSRSLVYSLPVFYFKDIDAGYILCTFWAAIGIALCGLVSANVCTMYILYAVVASTIISTSTLLVGTCFYAKEGA